MEEFRGVVEELDFMVDQMSDFEYSVKEVFGYFEKYVLDMKDAENVVELRDAIESAMSPGVDFYGEDMMIRHKTMVEYLDDFRTAFESLTGAVDEVDAMTYKW